MGLPVDLAIAASADRGLDQAEDLAGRLVVPVALVRHAVLGSDLDVAGVSGGDGLRGQPGDVVVGVEIRSACARTPSSGGSPCNDQQSRPRDECQGAGVAAGRLPGVRRPSRYTPVARSPAARPRRRTLRRSTRRGGLSSMAEHRIVAPKVTGSSPVGHPISRTNERNVDAGQRTLNGATGLIGRPRMAAPMKSAGATPAAMARRGAPAR